MIALVIAICVAGCVTYEQRLDDVRAEVAGLHALDLRGCLPVPRDARSIGELEHVTFEWKADFPTVKQEKTGRERWEESRRLERDGNLEAPRLPSEIIDPRALETVAGSCIVILEVAEGRITDLAVRGRSESGLNFDGHCLRTVEACAQTRAAHRTARNRESAE